MPKASGPLLPPPPTNEEIAQPQGDLAPVPQQAQSIDVVDPDGTLGSVPAEQAHDALAQGYRLATPEDHAEFAKQAKYGTAGQQVKAAVEGVGQGLAGPLFTGAERAIGVKPEDIRSRQEVNAGTHGTGEAVGLIAPAILSGGLSAEARAGLEGAGALTQSGLLEGAGKAAAKAVGLGAPESAAAKIGSAAVKGAVETALFEAGDEASKAITQDPNQTAESIAANIGLSGLMGLGLGTGFGGAGALWDATMGSKTAGVLKAVANKMGGIEGATGSEVEHAISASGMQLAPEIRAGLSQDPAVQNMFKTLEQSDTTSSGHKLQAAYTDFRKQAGDTMVESLGRTVDGVDALPSDLSAHEAGNVIGKTLAEEYHAQMDPLAKEFEALKSKYANADLYKRGETIDYSNPYKPVESMSTTDMVAEKVAQLAQEQGWNTSPSSDIMREVRRTLKDLPKLQTVKDLTNFVTRVGENTASTLPFGQQTPLSRAGSLIKNVLKDAESEVALARLGEKAPELIDRYQAARAAYKAQSTLKEALNDRLKVGGSTSGFAKGLRNMADTDGESIVRRLSGKGDADILKVLSENYPKTAQAVRDWHIDSTLKAAADKAKPGETVNARKLRTVMASMSPELRNFAIPEAAQARINSVGTLLDQFDKLPHNFSNTARTVDKLLSNVPGTALGMATMMMSHNPVTGLITGLLTKTLSKDAPDAIRLATLKFLGSNKPIEAEGFKAAVDYIHHAVKAEKTISSAVKNTIKAGGEVLTASELPTDASRAQLEKNVIRLQANPKAAMDGMDSKAAYYLPDHGPAAGQVAVRAANYLAGLKPNTQGAQPLDGKSMVNPVAKAAYNQALDIAQQPLIVLNKLSQGRLTPSDIGHLQNMFPGLYTKLQGALMEQVTDAKEKGVMIPYSKRMGLAMFLGQPLDSTMTPQGIMAAQPKPPQGQPETPTAPASGPKHSTKALAKLSSSYETPVQSASARRTARA